MTLSDLARTPAAWVRRRVDRVPLSMYWRRLTEYSSFEEANRPSYANPEIIDAVVAAARMLRDRPKLDAFWIDVEMAKILLGLARIDRRQPLRVLDFGGAGGDTFFRVERALPAVVGRWVVVESPAMVAAARGQFAGRCRDFVDLAREKLTNGFDIVLASGVLQFVPQPLATLERLPDVPAQHLYVARTQVSHRNRTIHTRHAGCLSHHAPGPLPSHFSDRIVSVDRAIVPQHELLAAVSRRCEVDMLFGDVADACLKIGCEWTTMSTIGFLAHKSS